MQMFLLSITGSFLMVVFVLWLFERERKRNRFSPFTEKMLRSPGYTLNKQLQDKGDSLLLPFLMLSFLPFLFVHLVKDVNLETRIVLGILLIVPIIWSVIKIRKTFIEMRKLKLGLEGEIYTGQELNYLMRQDAWVYHDIPYQYGNIDHIIISKAGIFTVETKAVSKPMNNKGGKKGSVIIKDRTIVFPHFTTSKPIEQAEIHAKSLKRYLKKKTGIDYPVFPIVALPGWFVPKKPNTKNGFLVVNPKRGHGIEAYLKTTRITGEAELNRAVVEIEEFARSVSSNTDITDPDAKKNYNFFLNRKAQEKKF